jgi:hypothetical protein
MYASHFFESGYCEATVNLAPAHRILTLSIGKINEGVYGLKRFKNDISAKKSRSKLAKLKIASSYSNDVSVLDRISNS